MIQSRVKRRIRGLLQRNTASHTQKLHPDTEKLPVQPESRQSHWQREIAALRLVVAEMQEELKGSQTRERHARYLAFHDDLTALPNRRYFMQRLGNALNKKTSDTLNLAVIYLDLNGFKNINDTHGHEAGDRLLNLIAGRLSHVVRPEDLVSRLGGDEYACLLAGVPNRDRLQHIASAMFDAVSAPFCVNSQRFTVRPSIGIAVYPADGTTTEALMKSADIAMYRAKGMGCSFRFSDSPART